MTLKGELGRFIDETMRQIDRTCESEDVILLQRQREIVLHELQACLSKTANLLR